MDRRFFLAFLLTALVVVMVPKIFPTPPANRPVSAPAASDSGRAPAGAGETAAVRADSAGRAAATAADSTASPTVRAETTLVATPKVLYRFASAGAAPVQVEMREYQALEKSGRRLERQVRFAHEREPILRYRLQAGDQSVSLSDIPFTLTSRPAPGSTGPLRYEAEVAGAPLVITYTFAPDSYLVRVQGAWQGSARPAALVVELPRGLRSEEADTVEDQRHTAYAFRPQGRGAERVLLSDVDSGEVKTVSRPLDWVVAKNKYFLVGLLTSPEDRPFTEFTIAGLPRAGTATPVTRATVTDVMPDGQFAFEMYTGPQEWRRLLALGREFENANPYGGFLQGVVQPFATIVMRLLFWLRDGTGLSYGWVLVIFGIVVRIALWPLNQTAMRSSLKMQMVQPELAEVQKKYANDPQKLQQELWSTYRKYGMTPFSTFSGCLPMLIPMPVLFALFHVFQNTIEFRGVPFLWLIDISLKDPYYILPVVMAGSMFLLSWIGMRNVPPNPQMKMMLYAMPLIFGAFFLTGAAGLNLYYAVQNFAALPQQWLIANERAKMGPPPTATPAPAPARAAAGKRSRSG